MSNFYELSKIENINPNKSSFSFSVVPPLHWILFSYSVLVIFVWLALSKKFLITGPWIDEMLVQDLWSPWWGGERIILDANLSHLPRGCDWRHREFSRRGFKILQIRRASSWGSVTLRNVRVTSTHLTVLVPIQEWRLGGHREFHLFILMIYQIKQRLVFLKHMNLVGRPLMIWS